MNFVMMGSEIVLFITNDNFHMAFNKFVCSTKNNYIYWSICNIYTHTIIRLFYVYYHIYIYKCICTMYIFISYNFDERPLPCKYHLLCWFRTSSRLIKKVNFDLIIYISSLFLSHITNFTRFSPTIYFAKITIY